MLSKEDYLKLLEENYQEENEEHEMTRLAYLGDIIFGFITYDSGMAELFAKKALETCEAINNSTTFEYIKDKENYRWYLLMVNIPFFANRIDWGTSIRGAWWKHSNEDIYCVPPLHLQQTRDDWGIFIQAMQDFVKEELREQAR